MITAAGPHADARRVLREWDPAVAGQEALRHAFLALLDARPDACLRACEPGHVTASAVLVDAPGEHVLLTLHPRVGAWLQLGGHCEPEDASLAGAALREATEESGIAGLAASPEPVHLDVHPITCSLGRPTRHFDVRYLVRAPAGARPVRSEESLDLRWWPVDALPEGSDLGPLLAAALG
ncbi:NUDIX hydrolase [Saccharopolyspora sp. MS10]|uniref:NUDIX hydrolase n=1 Tax=Saccharopolyspora sp. MS10 TaxID=3385973 RepID=UPI00399FE138